MRLVDADALKKHIQDDYNAIYKNYPDDLDAKNYIERHAALRKKEVGETCDWLFGFLTDKYTITDVAPVIHGNFIEKDDGFGETVWECSYCGEWWTLESGTPYENQYNYCPNCGADMRDKK